MNLRNPILRAVANASCACPVSVQNSAFSGMLNTESAPSPRIAAALATE